MLNHYEILGLPNGAGIPEVKAAFRQLAKQYHPDLNPGGREHFSKILRAYEVLSDPQLKYTYDYRLNASLSGQVQQPRQTVREKNWKFDERELKRRQYYNEHIKKYEKKQAAASQDEPVKRSDYNEFKYILLATPLAVLLFIGIMSLSSRNKPKLVVSASRQASTASLVPASDLKMGDAPFVWYFGPQQYKPTGPKMVIQNLTGADMVVCLFRKEEFVRSCFIEHNFSAEISELPAEHLLMRYSTGKNFSQSASQAGTSVTGAFTADAAFYRNVSPFDLNTINQLTLLPGLNEGFETIEARDFFRK